MDNKKINTFSEVILRSIVSQASTLKMGYQFLLLVSEFCEQLIQKFPDIVFELESIVKQKEEALQDATHNAEIDINNKINKALVYSDYQNIQHYSVVDLKSYVPREGKYNLLEGYSLLQTFVRLLSDAHSVFIKELGVEFDDNRRVKRETLSKAYIKYENMIWDLEKEENDPWFSWDKIFSIYCAVKPLQARHLRGTITKLQEKKFNNILNEVVFSKDDLLKKPKYVNKEELVFHMQRIIRYLDEQLIMADTVSDSRNAKVSILERENGFIVSFKGKSLPKIEGSSVRGLIIKYFRGPRKRCEDRALYKQIKGEYPAKKILDPDEMKVITNAVKDINKLFNALGIEAALKIENIESDSGKKINIVRNSLYW